MIRFLTGLLCLLTALGIPSKLAGQVVISEFLAENRTGLADEDGDASDWIELHNTSAAPIDLSGWFLTDDAAQLAKWRFPATLLSADGYLVVFASGKSRAQPGTPLHTSFRLDSAGEFLALVKPDGRSIASQFSPAFPRQYPDASYGLSGDATPIPLLEPGATGRVLIPTSDGIGSSWTGGAEPYDDTAWLPAVTGVGFDSPRLPASGSVLRGYWRFDDTPADTSGNRPAATLSGPVYSPDVSAALGSGKSLLCDGQNDFIDLGDPGMTSGSVAMWIKPADVGAGTGDRRLISQASGAVGQAGAIALDPGGSTGDGSLWVWNGSQWLRLCPDGAVKANQWQHLAVVARDGLIALYLDGRKQGTVSCAFQFNGTSMILGGPFLMTYGSYFAGNIDEVSLWSSALDDAGIAALAAGSPPPDPANYLPLIRTDLKPAMFNIGSSACLRLPFVVTDPAAIARLLLRMQYDDGFIAWLNGVEVARRNAPAAPAWNSAATQEHPAVQALSPEEMDLSTYRGLLHAGTNLLAIQGLNLSAADEDFLLAPALWAERRPIQGQTARYFSVPTPGAANGAVPEDVGPILANVILSPAQPAAAEPVLVTARVSVAFHPLSTVTLHYRVMFGLESSLPMLDDGQHGDGAAGDGIFGASIPAGTAAPDQMLRCYVTASDTLGHPSRWPLFNQPNDSPQYLGTVVANPAVTSPLPILHWFVEDPAAAATRTGTRASVFSLGEFYDNIFVRVHGAGSSTYPKPSQKFEFLPGYHFLYATNAPRVEEFNLITTYSDPSYVREQLAYELYRLAGAPAAEAFSYRVQRNGSFYSVDTFVEQPDPDYLAHHGLNPTGALYKMYNALENPVTRSYSFYTGDNDKQTRTWEDFSDLTNLVTAISPTNAPAIRARNLYDQVNIPALINYLATTVIMQDLDHETHNYFAYRDTEGTREWLYLPWDRNYSFGITDAGNVDPASHPFLGSSEYIYPPWQLLEGKDVQWNRLTDAIYDTASTREMFLRRLRTLMDALLQPPGVPDAQLRLSQRLAGLVGRLKTDVALDAARWGRGDFLAAISSLKSFLADRRVHLYTTHNLTNVARYRQAAGIPQAQEGSPPITFGRIEANPVSGNQDEEFIELVNPNPTAVDLSGWILTGPVRHQFQPGVVLPARGSLFVSPNVTAFRSRTSGPSGRQGLFVQGNYEGHLMNLGQTIQLLAPDGTLIATTTTPIVLSPAQQHLRITEIMYHPAPPPPGNTNLAQAFEYVELRNTGPDPLSLEGIVLTNGVSFTFGRGPLGVLGPGQRVLLVANLAAFATRHDTNGLVIAGEFAGSLDNTGEPLALLDRDSQPIQEFTYDGSWFPVADGLGFCIVIRDDRAPTGTWSSKSSWRPSGTLEGSPGIDDPPLTLPAIVINEVLARPLPPGLDTVELFNPTADDVDLGGWFLTDDRNAPKKFRIRAGTMLPAGGFAVFNENQFNTSGTLSPFAFGARGEEVFLFSGDATTNLTGYSHGFAFGASAPGVSFGRYLLSTGEEDFPAQFSNSFSATNTGPRPGPIVISEIHYHPREGGDEFIELKNISGAAVKLFDPARPTNTWRIAGLNYTLPPGLEIPADGLLLVVASDPDGFRSAHAVPAGVPVLGPSGGILQDGGETLELQRPDEAAGPVTYIGVDQVRYRPHLPWPEGADGAGPSLQRSPAAGHGNDPIHWHAGFPTPGTDYSGVPGPFLTAQPADQSVLAFTHAALLAEAAGAPPLFYQWRYNGTNLPGATNSVLSLSPVQPADAGTYSVVVFNAGGSVISSNATLTVRYPPRILAQPVSIATRPGTAATFSVSAIGSGPLQYQWRLNGVDVANATNPALAIASVQLADAGAYTVTIADQVGSILSAPASLVVLIAPGFTVQPVSRSVAAGGSVTFSVAVSNITTLPVGFRWRRNGATVAFTSVNQFMNFYTLTNAQADGTYTVVVTNAATPGGVLSSGALLTVLADTDHDGLPDAWETANQLDPGNAADALLDLDGDTMTSLEEYLAGTNPRDAASRLQASRWPDHAGGPGVTFEAVSNRTYTVEWREAVDAGRWTKLADVPARASNHVERIRDPYPAADGRLYRLLTPRQPDGPAGPRLLQTPRSMLLEAGSGALLEVFAVGTGSLSYQWFFNDTPIGAATSNLTVTPTQAGLPGSYTVVVTDELGATTNEPPVILAVRPQLLTQPQDQDAALGQTIQFRVTATSNAPLRYRWRRNGQILAGENSATLTLENVQPSDAGIYQAIVSHQTPLGVAGSSSSHAVLTVK